MDYWTISFLVAFGSGIAVYVSAKLLDRYFPRQEGARLPFVSVVGVDHRDNAVLPRHDFLIQVRNTGDVAARITHLRNRYFLIEDFGEGDARPLDLVTRKPGPQVVAAGETVGVPFMLSSEDWQHVRGGLVVLRIKTAIDYEDVESTITRRHQVRIEYSARDAAFVVSEDDVE